MATPLDERTLLRAPAYSVIRTASGPIALDPAAPHWMATDQRGLDLLGRFDGTTPLGDVVKRYAAQSGLDTTRAWLHVDTFARDAMRRGFLTSDGAAAAPYLGRSTYLEVDQLRELWIQVNDFCNLACEHCLVSSGPTEPQGLETERLVEVVDQAVDLGTERFFLTGGEPLARPDIIELATHVVSTRQRELFVLTNGTLLAGERLDALARLGDTGRLHLQISLDGSDPDVNDPVRGRGSFARIVAGIRAAVAADLAPTMTMTILRHNLGDLNGMVTLASELGVRHLHFLWPHARGRLLESRFADLPSTTELLTAVRSTRDLAATLDVTIDNLEELRLRFDGTPGVKRDLAGAGWNSLCVSTDGCVYPSASLAGVPDVRCGDLADASLESIWRTSAVCHDLREATVEAKPTCRSCMLKFLCGGGDFEHGYWASKADTGTGSFLGHDPFCELYQGLAEDTFAEFAAEGAESVQPRSGYDRPVVLRAMGEQTLETEAPIVRTTHSACVLSEELLNKSRAEVREFYGQAAEEPQAELCCPTQPDEADLGHIPAEVIERFYGCGSPVSSAHPTPGETFVDLGSGAGIDCFIAAKRVGTSGRVVGIDMTDQMLEVARDCQPKVAEALGYDAVEFRKGFLESIPLDDGTADVVTSNCVINLSSDKPRVFREIWRVLNDHGRVVIADIVSDREVPPKMRADGRLWGECISGAMTEAAFLDALERSGFYGLSIVKKTFWKTVQDCQFWSVTVRGFKFEKKAGCTYVGQYAIYRGPQKAVVDEEGHLFPRAVPVEVCTDTASKLQHPPYAEAFVIVDGPVGARELTSADNGCGPDCC